MHSKTYINVCVYICMKQTSNSSSSISGCEAGWGEGSRPALCIWSLKNRSFLDISAHLFTYKQTKMYKEFMITYGVRMDMKTDGELNTYHDTSICRTEWWNPLYKINHVKNFVSNPSRLLTGIWNQERCPRTSNNKSDRKVTLLWHISFHFTITWSLIFPSFFSLSFLSFSPHHKVDLLKDQPSSRNNPPSSHSSNRSTSGVYNLNSSRAVKLPTEFLHMKLQTETAQFKVHVN